MGNSCCSSEAKGE
jgi:hypothetical protein